MSEKKINVVLIHSSFVIGGAENMVYELGKSLNPNEVNTTVITLSSRLGTSLEKKVDDAGISVKYAGCEGRVTIKKLMRVYHMTKEAKADVVHAHMSGVVYSILWTLCHKSKLVITVHTTPEKAFNSRVKLILKFLSYINKTVLVTVSNENEKLLLEKYRLTTRNVKCINNGVDLTRFYYKKHEGIRFINVGRHDDNKNQELIIRLFIKLHRDYPTTSLILCGDGPEHQKYVDLAENMIDDKSIVILGNVSNVEDYLAESDIYIQASHREGLPLSTLEAMASKLPVISTNVGGMKNIVKGNGFLVPDNNQQALFNAMEKFVLEKDLREQCGEESLRIVKDFSSVKMADEYLKLYYQCR